MKKISRLIKYLSVTMLILSMISGCDNSNEIAEYLIPPIKSVEDGNVAENENYALKWDDKQKCVLLESKEDGYIWSTVPYNFYLENDTNVNLSSPVFIEYYSPFDGSLETSKAFSDCIDEGGLSVTTVKNGLKLEFYFDAAEITIPLYLTLRDKSVLASIPLNEIVESGKTKLVSVSVLPYFCSAANRSDNSAYLLIPVGSGALIYTHEEIQDVSRSFSGSVYGEDKAQIKLDNTADGETIHLPVYGVKDDKNALFAIIEGSPGAARINAEAGNFRNGYSTVYADFQVRGFDEVEAVRNGYSDERIYSDEFSEASVYSVGYFPLKNNAAGYTGMAELYKEYLNDNGLITKTKEIQMAYRAEILGGSMVKKFAMGFPYRTLQAATTFTESRQIIENLTKETGQIPSVTLRGFGKSGTDAGVVAGGFGFSSKLGGSKGYKAVREYCEKNGVPLHLDFDLIHFNTSGKGFINLIDTAKTAGMKSVTYYPLFLSTRSTNKNASKIHLLSRNKLDAAAKKLTSYTKERVAGVSLSIIGSLAYSDYDNAEYYLQGALAEQISPLLKEIKKNGHSLSLNAANAYAAGLADSVADVPTSNGGYIVFDEAVPFYQLIFAGETALYSTPVNISAGSRAMLLKALEFGVSPSFSLYYKYNEKFADNPDSLYYGSLYESALQDILKILNEMPDYFEILKGRYITNHEMLAKGITRTTFSDGNTVTINHNNTAAETEGKNIKAQGYYFGTE